MTNKEFYKKKAEYHFRLYQPTVEAGNTKLMKYHEQEYLTYDKAAKALETE